MKRTQSEIAAEVGISQSYYSEVLRAIKVPSCELAEKLELVTGKHRLWWLYRGQYDVRGRKLRPVGEAEPSRRTSSRRCSDRGGEDRRKQERRGEGDQGPKGAA